MYLSKSKSLPVLVVGLLSGVVLIFGATCSYAIALVLKGSDSASHIFAAIATVSRCEFDLYFSAFFDLYLSGPTGLLLKISGTQISIEGGVN